MNTISEFIDRLWQFLGGFADSMNDSDYAIYYVIRDKFFALVLQGITEGFSFLFGEFLNSIYRILFSNPSGTVSTRNIIREQTTYCIFASGNSTRRI